MKKCPKCGCEDFEITADTHDSCTYLVTIDDDGSVSTNQIMKEYCGDSDWYGNAKCGECGCNIDIQTGTEIEAGVEIIPYSVLLLYPDYMADEYGHETYYSFEYGKNEGEAIEAAQKGALGANPDYKGTANPEDFYPLAVFRGHLQMEKNGQ